MMAFDSQSKKSPSWSAGVLWFGLSLMNSGFICSPFKQIHSFKLGIESEMDYDRKNLARVG
jgi:hypothetical protein